MPAGRSKRRIAISLDLKWLFGRHTQVFAGTQRYAETVGWDCVIDEFLPASLSTATRHSKPYDGIIARVDADVAAAARRCRIPVVNVWLNTTETDVPAVFPDFALAGRLSATHLIDRGLRTLGCLTNRRDRAHGAMLDGFHGTLGEHGLTCICQKTSGRMPPRTIGKWRDFERALTNWSKSLPRPAGVLLAYNDITNRHVASFFQREGRRIPEDIAMIAGANETAVCLNPAPSLTGVDLGFESIGFEAARYLDELIDGRTPDAAPRLLATPRIVARQSTDFFATNDELVSRAYRFLADNFADPLTVGDVAHAARTTRRTLQRRFLAATGRTIVREITRLRIESAKRLLLDSNQPIKQIAMRTGFVNSTQFGQVFRRITGMTPTAFRRSK